ncbi:uncharacterized protein AB675_6329 [Cyphellophora attinorum]|uniref:Uncharacterized protein n=1 Tax=Cyphellophora attinorum TaxID=1664694 RepID=A0A0N1P2H7_9EURO|nr:uncharacterized protein AB675_6329 [Phialophora attinorum]KPI43886.1 hypothetical protein AB675_6329 [Phialophora attinorum]
MDNFHRAGEAMHYSAPEKQTSRASPKRKRGQETPTIPIHAAGYPILESDVYLPEVPSPSTKVVGKLRKLNIGDHDSNPHKEAQASGLQRLPLQPKTSTAHTPYNMSPKMQFTETEPAGASDYLRYQEADPIEQAATSANLLDRPKSPKLSGKVNSFYWQDSEITGHDPKDPDDDLYGINGIGFKPTPAIAQQRSQQRKKQLLEYRNREAKEARQQRSERRRMALTDGPYSEPGPSIGQGRARVRFDNG